MKGNPKYKLGDRVKWKYPSEDFIYEGEIYIIDKYGTFENPTDVSYDIMADNDTHFKENMCLHKHVTESLIIE